MTKCKICNTECKSNRSLSKHIRDKHPQYTSQSYYDEFIKTDKNGKCKVCNALTRFTNLTLGYKNTCGHKCAGTLVRQEMAANEEKHQKFKEKVADNQTNIWRQRKLTGAAELIHKKVSDTVKKKNTTLTKEEIRDKYGWLNKLTQDRKKEWIESVQKQTGMHTWWKNASDEDRKDTITRRNATKLGISIEEYKNRYKNIDEFKNYKWVVWVLTEQTYKKYKDIIDPEHKRSPEFHLDHKFSVVRGFQTQTSPEIISSIYNLEILTSTENSAKSGKCSINIELLKEMYYGKILPGDVSGKKY
jgi:hypothetical protein